MAEKIRKLIKVNMVHFSKHLTLLDKVLHHIKLSFLYNIRYDRGQTWSCYVPFYMKHIAKTFRKKAIILIKHHLKYYVVVFLPLWVTVIYCQPQATQKKWRSTELIVDIDGMGHDDDDIFLKQKPFSVSWCFENEAPINSCPAFLIIC